MDVWAFGSSRKEQQGLCIVTDIVLMAYKGWKSLDYLNMVAKQGFVDSKGINSVSEVTWLNFRTLGFHHDSVPGETWPNHCVEHNFSDELSHSEETRGLRRARQRDSAPGEETPELRGATRIDSAVTQGQNGHRPRLRYSRSHHCDSGGLRPHDD